ncbi:hypothetical protein H6800_03410 [Candidatus Nomurabacteria bacterium]|mgnify:CR=1 FL=1|nr:hypothetical protein [Candidatus Nomurabacteria bacterium]
MDLDLIEASLKTAPTAGDAAGIWWAGALKSPQHDNGADDPANIMARALADRMTEESPASAGALELFAGEVARVVNELVDAGREYISLGVDYSPDMILVECAERAHLEVPMMGWPWKTNMWVTPTSVKVSHGYRAEAKLIWGSES